MVGVGFAGGEGDNVGDGVGGLGLIGGVGLCDELGEGAGAGTSGVD